MQTHADSATHSYWDSGEPDPIIQHWEITLSEEYTDEDLVTDTEAALEDADAGVLCFAYKNLSEDQSTLTLQKFRFKLKHSPTGTCYLKVWLQKRFHPKDGAEDGSDDTITGLPDYEWSGTGTPCFTDSEQAYDADDNKIESDWTAIDAPTDEGTTTVEIKKFSCIEGYEPPDDGRANGFPAP